MTGPARTLMHATCIAVDGRGLLITGPAGAGKSGLAIRLLGLGARLVSDDQTELWRDGARVMARCPAAPQSGLIEARGLGILRVPHVERAALALVADLSRVEPDRLPPHRTVQILDCALPLVLQVQNDHFAEALMLYLRHGRQA